MVEGFKLRVSWVELKGHCQKRAAYHRERAEEKRTTLPQLKEALELMKAAPSTSNSLSHMNKGGYQLDPAEPVRDLENDIRNHENKALVFDFFASHLIEDDYTLQESDLIKLEILKQ